MLERVNILGIEYKIEYFENASEVDGRKRESLWGSIDFWERTIRIYIKDRSEEDIFQTILHEILHGIAAALHLELDKEENHDELDVIALSLADVLHRNNLLKGKE